MLRNYYKAYLKIKDFFNNRIFEKYILIILFLFFFNILFFCTYSVYSQYCFLQEYCAQIVHFTLLREQKWNKFCLILYGTNSNTVLYMQEWRSPACWTSHGIGFQTMTTSSMWRLSTTWERQKRSGGACLHQRVSLPLSDDGMTTLGAI